jgi:hypothetical protein
LSKPPRAERVKGERDEEANAERIEGTLDALEPGGTMPPHPHHYNACPLGYISSTPSASKSDIHRQKTRWRVVFSTPRRQARIALRYRFVGASVASATKPLATSLGSTVSS